MSFIDTHCHPYLAKNKNEKDMIQNFTASGGTFFVSIGIDVQTSKQSLSLARKYDFAYTSIGLHPCDIYDLNLEASIAELESIYLENKDKVVAIGETGLDYYWMVKDAEKKETIKKYIEEKKEIQNRFFRAQIGLAKKYNLPLIIHNRDAKQDILGVLKQEDYRNFIMHCFAEDLKFAQECIEFAPNCKISFSGIVTFKNAKDIQDSAQNIPLKNILIETDSPYLTPDPYRGKQENEPAFTKYVLKKIQEIRIENPELIEKQILKNSMEVFKIS